MSFETTTGDNGINVRDDVQSFCEQHALEADSQVQADVVSLLDKPDTVDVKQFLHLLRTTGNGWRKDRTDRAVEIYSMFVESRKGVIDSDTAVEDADVVHEEAARSALTDTLGQTTLHIVQATESQGASVAPEEKAVIRHTGLRRRLPPLSEAEITPCSFARSSQASDDEVTRLFEGEDTTDEEWQDKALCMQTDPEVFFPEKGGSTKEAKRVCRECEVSVQCLASALRRGERYGIWGGLSERERRKLQKKGDDPLVVARGALG